jgi:hypothetical protein
MMKFSRFIRGIPALTAVAWAVLSMAASPAQAAMKLMISDGTTTITIQDNMAGDLNATVGAIQFSGVVGDFIVNGELFTTKPVLGSASLPAADLSFADVFVRSAANVGVAETLTIAATDTDYTQGAQGNLSESIGGTINTTGVTVSGQTFLDGSNTEFGTPAGVPPNAFPGPLLGPLARGQGGVGSAFSAASAVNHGAMNTPFSMTSVVSVAVGSTVSTASVSGDYSVEDTPAPEPATVLAALTGLILPLTASAVRRIRRPQG